MAASFIGLTVEIQLITGETISGVISNVDPIGGLSVYNPGNHSSYNINRNQIRDLQLIQQQQQQPQSQSQQQPSSSYSNNSHSNSFATHSDPAILSLSSNHNHNHNQIQNHTSFSNQNQNQVTPSSISAPSTSNQSIPQPHQTTSNHNKNQNKQTNDSVSNQIQNQIVKVEKSKKVQEEKNKSKKNGNGNGKNQQQSASQSNVKGKSKAKNGNHNSNGNTNGNASYPNGIGGGFEEDFDFSAGLNNFDKKAIWEEIRISDQSDKSTLLVSHNRISQSRDQGSSSPSPHPYPYHSTKQLTKDGRNGQTKLAPNENVLSPEPDEDQDQDEDDREVEELLEKVKEGGLNLNGESFEQEEDEDEDEDESEEFMEALSSPSPAFASSIKRNGSSSSKKTTGMLEIPNSTLTLPESQKLPQPNFSERPRSSSSTSQNLNGNLESITTSTTTSTSTQSLLSEIQSLKEKLILFETLSSISLDLNPKLNLRCANAEEKESQVYDCRLNGFKFSLACFFDQHQNQSRGGSPSPSLERIRYLPSRSEEGGGGNEDGNGVGESQEEILKKLPGHYSKEIGLRPENAGVFIGRLRDALKS